MTELSRPVEEIDVETAAAEVSGGADLIDVREDFEWQRGRAAGARHIPLRDLPSQLDELPRTAPIYLICATGNRSGKAAEFLRQSGFAQPINVRGGTKAWERAGLPIER